MSLNLYSREDGIAVGKEILGLLIELQPELREQCETFLSKSELEFHLAEIERRTPKYGEKCKCVEGLLSQILKPTTLQSNLITIWGVDVFWDNQSDYAPICEIDKGLGFIQFGDWCGQTDGEAWFFDSEYGRIGTLGAGQIDYSADSLRASFEAKSIRRGRFRLFCDVTQRSENGYKNLTSLSTRQLVASGPGFSVVN